LTRQGHSIRRECRTLDGIQYEIVVLAASGGISARWECKACGASAVNSIPKPTEQEALALAYDSLNNHHIRVHPTVGRPESPASQTPSSQRLSTQNGDDHLSNGN
jgi:hypothetical protein